jgi:hypothetical protein
VDVKTNEEYGRDYLRRAISQRASLIRSFADRMEREALEAVDLVERGQAARYSTAAQGFVKELTILLMNLNLDTIISAAVDADEGRIRGD